MEDYGVSSVTPSGKGLFAGHHPRVTIPITIRAGAGQLEEGTVLGLLSSSGEWVPYDSSGTGGEEVPRAILARPVDASGADPVHAVAYVHGEFQEEALVGFDEDARLPLMERGIYVKGRM